MYRIMLVIYTIINGMVHVSMRSGKVFFYCNTEYVIGLLTRS